MTTRTRQIAVAMAFAATVAAAVTGMSLRAETHEAPTVAEKCLKADWPLIPAECLDGMGDRHIRLATEAQAATQKFVAVDMSDRFAVAFQ